VFADHIVLRAIFDISLVLIATCSASTFYVASQREVFRTWGESLKYLPFLVSLGVGVSLNNARAAIEGLLGQSSEFVRTPKFGVAGRGDKALKSWSQSARRQAIQAWSELAMGLYQQLRRLRSSKRCGSASFSCASSPSASVRGDATFRRYRPPDDDELSFDGSGPHLDLVP
jgi:hypothetical protein